MLYDSIIVKLALSCQECQFVFDCVCYTNNMNMFKPVGANSREEYINSLTPDRKAIIISIDRLIQKTVPGLKPNFLYNMLGYGEFDYINYKKENIKWPVVALASQKNYISLYVCAVVDGQYLAEKYKVDLGKVSVGKSCIRFKKLEHLNLEVLKKLLVEAAKNPGLQIDK